MPQAILNTDLTLRAAATSDAESVARVWFEAWPDGHDGHVPNELRQHRQLDHFRLRVPGRLEHTTVAMLDGVVVGFLTVHDDEVEQIYVDRSARGTGVAATLLRHGEQVIASNFDVAWLAVVAGNARARTFYARQGWRDAGPIDYEAEVVGGTMNVPSHRYEKRVAIGARS